MREQIRLRFEDNIGRAQNLVVVYREIAGQGQGRRPVHSTDILRAAIVFAHAALEEVFRGLATWKYPAAGEQVLNEVPLVGLTEHSRPEKFFLGKLANHRQKTVQELINESVRSYLGSFTVNNTTDISGFLRKISVDPDAVSHEFAQLTELISRRHHIVHQADRNDIPGRGNHRARGINPDDVARWLGATTRFVTQVLELVQD